MFARGGGVTGQGGVSLDGDKGYPLCLSYVPPGPPGGCLQPCCCHATGFLIWFNDSVAHVSYLRCFQVPAQSLCALLLLLSFFFLSFYTLICLLQACVSCSALGFSLCLCSASLAVAVVILSTFAQPLLLWRWLL